MKSVLRQLFDHTTELSDHLSANNPQYNAIWAKILEEETHLLQKLPGEDSHCLTAMEDDLREAYCIEIYESFSRGFCLGMTLLWEVIQEDT